MKLIRSMNGQILNGGVTRAATASAKNVPNRPSESTTAIVRPPTASKGRSAGASGRSGMRAAVDSQRTERELLAVQVVLQVEDPGEARSIPEGVLPRAVVALRPQKIIDAALDRRAARTAGREEAQQRPRGLTRNRLAHAGKLVVVVALAGLAPPAVPVLVALEPSDRALDVLVTRIHADGGEPAQHRPRAIDVVHAPAAVPRSVVSLRVAEEIDRALGGLEVLPVAERAEELEAAPGQVLRRWVEQGAVVGERDVIQIEAVVVGVERTPASVGALHPEEPAEPALLGRSRKVGVEPLHLLEGHHDHRRIVEVGVEVVVVLERPAAGLHVRTLHLPVAGDEDLPRDHPLTGAAQLRVIRREITLDEGVDRERRVPSRPGAGLVVEPVAALDGQRLD